MSSRPVEVPGFLRGNSAKTFDVVRSAQSGAGDILRAGFLVMLLSMCAIAGAHARPAQGQGSHPAIMLIHATVFSSQGYAVQYARVRLRRDTETKWRWETATDDEGEFALHVPQGVQYVLRVDAKGFQPLTQNIDGAAGDDVELTLRLIPLAGGK
ncbi:MAG: carboxypeptidase-like regulatory domain-containing protein [Candidatus Acidiferrales bacterium]